MSTPGDKTVVTWNGAALGEIVSIGDVNIQAELYDASYYNATNNMKKYLLGQLDADEIAITVNFEPESVAGQAAFAADVNAGTTRNLVITFPAAMGAAWTIAAMPKGFSTAQPKGGAITATYTVKPDGLPSLGLTAVVGMSACGFSNDVLMNPTFDIAKFEYVVTITNGQTSTVITPVDASAGEIITITANGASQVVATGVAATAITLSATDPTDIVIKITHATKVSKTYTFRCAILAA